jgi:ribosomal protein L7/L12
VAVQYKSSSLNGAAFVEALGFAAEAKQLLDHGWQFKLTAKSLVLEMGPHKFSKELSVAFLQAFWQGQAPEEDVASFKKGVLIMIQDAKATTDPASLATTVADLPKQQNPYLPLNDLNKATFFAKHGHLLAAGKKIELIKKFREVFLCTLQAAKEAVEAWEIEHKIKAPVVPSPVKTSVAPEQIAAAKTIGAAGKWPLYDLSKLKTGPTVKLRDAKAMYQPVKGSSSGSRYFLVAADDDVRVAARYHASSLSIRVEGPGWKKHKATISDSGFSTVDESKDYASVHLTVADDMLANKTLGAVLLGLGVPFETPMPMLSVVKGKGG